jgi:hypothetical protein
VQSDEQVICESAWETLQYRRQDDWWSAGYIMNTISSQLDRRSPARIAPRRLERLAQRRWIGKAGLKANSMTINVGLKLLTRRFASGRISVHTFSHSLPAHRPGPL